MNHLIVKLVSGEFVYGVLDDSKEDKSMIVLSNPLTWHEYADDEGRLGSALVKYINGTNDNRVPISISSITSMSIMSPIFEEFYEAAVAVQQITDEAYNESLSHMTARMYDLVLDHQDRIQALSTNELVISHKKTANTTVH